MGFLSGRFLAPAPFRPNDYLSVIRGDGDVNIDEIVSLHKTENDPTAPLVLSNVIEENELKLLEPLLVEWIGCFSCRGLVLRNCCQIIQ
jgi:hypothetical protein